MTEMAIVRMFAAARQAAGTGRDELPGDNVGEVLDHARERYGDEFSAVLTSCRVWVNGEAADEHTPVGAEDEMAVLPPVSGGAV
jgi:molybdopterin synthase sulfur carrier subunit